jgi:hypothetical protein
MDLIIAQRLAVEQRIGIPTTSSRRAVPRCAATPAAWRTCSTESPFA